MDTSERNRLHHESFVFDLHTHGPGFVPQPFRSMWRAAAGAPPEDGFEALRRGGVDAAVTSAVGDPIVTRCYPGRSPWAAVDAQLNRIERQATAADAVVATSVAALQEARAQRTPAVLLGIEGADALGHDVDLVDAWLAPLGVTTATPREHERRGSHVTVRHPRFREVVATLWQEGVVPDFRGPDALRIGLSPLSTAFDEVRVGVAAIREAAAAGYRVCVYTQEERRFVLASCLAAGATGVVSKSSPLDETQAAFLAAVEEMQKITTADMKKSGFTVK